MGWLAPGKLIQEICRYVTVFFGEPENILLRECRNSNSNKQESHVCKNDCCIVCPLQNDGDICGIVCIVVASIVILVPRFWEYILITKSLNRKGNPCQYLHKPTKFCRYLGTVVMTWFSNENVDMEMIIENKWILGDINESISTSDQENYENEKVGEKNQVASEETIKKETVVIDKENFKCSDAEKYSVDRAISKDILTENINRLNLTMHRMLNAFVYNVEKDSIRSRICRSIFVKIINLFSFTKQRFTVHMQVCNLS